MKKVEKIIDTVKRNFYLLVDLYFEKVNRLDLGGIISRENLKSNNPESIVHATAYQAVWNINLNDLLNEINKNGCKYGNFIDIGSGKGKACFYAYKRKITLS